MISLTNQKIQFFILFQVSAIQFLQLFCNVLYESTQNLLLTTKYAKSTFTDARWIRTQSAQRGIWIIIENRNSIFFIFGR
jgi:hypothetical protein